MGKEAVQQSHPPTGGKARRLGEKFQIDIALLPRASLRLNDNRDDGRLVASELPALGCVEWYQCRTRSL